MREMRIWMQKKLLNSKIPTHENRQRRKKTANMKVKALNKQQ